MRLESLLASGGRPAKDAGIGDRSMNSKLWKKMRILLAKVLVEREVIFAEDVERIFGKRPWASRSEEIMALEAADSKPEALPEPSQPSDGDTKEEEPENTQEGGEKDMKK